MGWFPIENGHPSIDRDSYSHYMDSDGWMDDNKPQSIDPSIYVYIYYNL